MSGAVDNFPGITIIFSRPPTVVRVLRTAAGRCNRRLALVRLGDIVVRAPEHMALGNLNHNVVALDVVAFARALDQGRCVCVGGG